MKIKPLYIYLILVLFIVIGIVTTNYFSQNEVKDRDNIANQQMPNDDIHKNLPNDDIHKGLGINPGSPSKDNVKEEFWKKLENLKAEVKKNPNDTAKVYQLANYLSQAHKPADAIDLYNSILKKDPKRIDVLMRLGLVYFQQHEYDKCESVTKKIIDIQPNNSQAIYNLGAVKATQGKNDEAKKIWSDIIKRFPGTEAAEFAKTSITNLK